MPSVIRGSDNFDTAGGNAVKAWVNFNGTGTVAIRASYNVSSITDNGTGDYTVNFANAMPDTSYACVVTVQQGASGNAGIVAGELSTRTASAIQIRTSQGTANADTAVINVAIFR